MPDGGDPFLHLRRDRLAATLAAMPTLAGSPQAEMVRAIGDGRCAAAFVHRGAGTINLRALEQRGMPVVIVFHDDDGRSSGPAGFPCARKALRWARAHYTHGTGAEPGQYEAAVRLAEAHGSCALIETSSAMAAEWATLARRAAMPRRAPGLVLIPPPGGVHPVAAEVQH